MNEPPHGADASSAPELDPAVLEVVRPVTDLVEHVGDLGRRQQRWQIRVYSQLRTVHDGQVV